MGRAMRYVRRASLDIEVLRRLSEMQARTTAHSRSGTLLVDRRWKDGKRTAAVRSAKAVLISMAGRFPACMYCNASEANDIDHFWPKADYHESMFVWENFILSCSVCGGLKGSRFPLSAGLPMIVNPTQENPWMFLDFDPKTGNIVERYDPEHKKFSERGRVTVEILHLDRREWLSSSYVDRFIRIAEKISDVLDGRLNGGALCDHLSVMDDCGLLPWCFGDTAVTVDPIRQLHETHRATWLECRARFC